jgi:methylmalonyl-CoA mutase
MSDLLKERGASHIKIFGGGGGVILPEEIRELMQYGIARIYSPDDGRSMGLQGMINDLVAQSDFPLPPLPEEVKENLQQSLCQKEPGTIARLITLAETRKEEFDRYFGRLEKKGKKTPV